MTEGLCVQVDEGMIGDDYGKQQGVTLMSWPLFRLAAMSSVANHSAQSAWKCTHSQDNLWFLKDGYRDLGSLDNA